MALEERDARHHLGRAGVQLDVIVMPERTGCRGEHAYPRGEDRGRRDRAGPCDRHPAGELFLRDPRKVEGDAASGRRDVEALLVRLDPADTGSRVPRQDLDLFPDPEGPFDERPGHDRAETGERERAIDGQARPVDVPAGRRTREDVRDLVNEIVKAAPRRRRDLDERRGRERGIAEDRGHIRARERRPFIVDQIPLRQCDDAALDAEDAKDRQMLARLGHDALVERHDEQHGIDRTDPGQHVADEVLVTRDVHDAEVPSIRQTQPGETEVDRHPPLALLAEPIGIDAGERRDERRLPMVDVAGRGDDPGPPRRLGRRAPRHAARVSVGPRCIRSRPCRPAPAR